MRIRILVDNAALTDRYYLAEPGFSALVETGDGRVLFDLGYSGAAVENARRMGEDILGAGYVVLSHGHLDHTWGLFPYIMAMTEARMEERQVARPTLVAHPDAFQTKKTGNLPETGSLVALEKCAEHFEIHLSREPVRLFPGLYFLGEIPRRYPFEDPGEQKKRVKRVAGGGLVPDPLLDDSALAYEGREGLVIVTGCAHSGICNTVARAREVCGGEKVADIIGGFHLAGASPERLERTVDTLRELSVSRMHPCHCTGEAAICRLAAAFEVGAVGSGWESEYA
ncbi:MAG: MBL fold metallo-hydrolase [Methanolinea sp.]